MQKVKEKLTQESVFPTLSYLATGYFAGFIVTTFLSVFVSLTAGPLGQELSEALWGAEKVVAFAVIAVVMIGAIIDYFRKAMTQKQCLITVGVSIVFGVIAQFLYPMIEMMMK